MQANNCEQLHDGKQALDAGKHALAFRSLLPFAEAGNAEAQSIIGFLYYMGMGVDRDLHMAIEWLRKAIDQGRGDAAHNLGTLYLTCEPELPRNPEKTRELYLKAKDLGFIVTTDEWYEKMK